VLQAHSSHQIKQGRQMPTQCLTPRHPQRLQLHRAKHSSSTVWLRHLSYPHSSHQVKHGRQMPTQCLTPRHPQRLQLHRAKHSSSTVWLRHLS